MRASSSCRKCSCRERRSSLRDGSELGLDVVPNDTDDRRGEYQETLDDQSGVGGKRGLRHGHGTVAGTPAQSARRCGGDRANSNFSFFPGDFVT